MSIRPIDLQTMFMRMNDLSKEQSIAQAAQAVRQAAQDAQAARQAKEKTEKVTGLNEVFEGPEKIGDDENHGQDQGEEGARNKSSPGEMGAEVKPDEKPPLQVIQDPNLGSKIDISG